jgi:hypothetical protein
MMDGIQVWTKNVLTCIIQQEQLEMLINGVRTWCSFELGFHLLWTYPHILINGVWTWCKYKIKDEMDESLNKGML